MLADKGHKLLKRDKKLGYKEPWLLAACFFSSKKIQLSRKSAQAIWHENADRGRVSRPKVSGFMGMCWIAILQKTVF
ncbi:hypothetical protein N482_18285 [Pseudoalteromonas luteoviolacea NCIMB 1942]|uniref:Uncharacterized protein n=1 Tax=Pseudoalteromonas luteoviolacea NCIMB 1942 TaxID=1365253 RepID=A0A166Z6C3_9GAMM|nr:hypothetical protein N482_18285 [Pseudoalteromonas luteoviolacea NCIMB 1942]